MNLFVSCVIACAVFGVSLGDIPQWDGFTLQYTTNIFGYGEDGFITVPPTTADAITKNWTVVETTFRVPVTMRCKKGNQGVCVIYSGNGEACGVVINIPVAFYEAQPIPYKINRWNFFEKKMINGVEYYSCTLYIVHPDVISAGGRTGNNVGTGDGIWYQVGDGLYNIPTTEKELAVAEGGLWKKQSCFLQMGTHWGRNISKEQDCMDHFVPAPLTTSGIVDGIAFQLPGSSVGYADPWFETVPAAIVRIIFPDAPQCLVDWVGTYGLISLHVWFRSSPQYTNLCLT